MEQLNKKETSLILRTCAADLTSRGGFQWPDVGGIVEVPDWKPTDECGNGAHGWLYGQGDHSCSSYLDSTAKWLVVEVESDSIVMLGGKCKFPKGIVRFVGDKRAATQYLIEHEPRAREVAVIGITVTVGDSQSAIGGALSMLTGGDRSTLTGGNRSTLTGGYGSTLTGGDRSTLTGGNRSTLTGGDDSTLTGGYGSTLTGGDRSTLTGGDDSTLTGGDDSTLTGGYGSTLTGGDDSTLTGGDDSELRIRYWDNKANRYRTVIAYVGEDGIEANVAYRLDDNRKFVKVEES
ncbi:hypothetical protein AB4120_14980 [Cupriavidus sp. 2KB_3]|uniref:hypothetical protein n=1 Tax=Cupriavidus sp. 2KB_3 TaxID=3232980 RepID=UPI003F917156